jgi:hypothetical protein
MSHVVARWRKLQCRHENGVFFADDTYVPISLRLRASIEHGGFHPRPRCAIKDAESDDGWKDVSHQEGGVLTHGKWRLRWGGKNWTGGGWLALEDSSGDLVWLFHTLAIEEIQQARLEGITVVASAPRYFPHEFRMDIISPELGSFGLPRVPNDAPNA